MSKSNKKKIKSVQRIKAEELVPEQRDLICSKQELKLRLQESHPKYYKQGHGRCYYSKRAVPAFLKGIEIYNQRTDSSGKHNMSQAQQDYSDYLEDEKIDPQICPTYDAIRKDQQKDQPLWTAHNSYTILKYSGTVFEGHELHYDIVADVVARLGDTATERTVTRAVNARVYIPKGILELFFRAGSKNISPRVRRRVRAPLSGGPGQQLFRQREQIKKQRHARSLQILDKKKEAYTEVAGGIAGEIAKNAFEQLNASFREHDEFELQKEARDDELLKSVHGTNSSDDESLDLLGFAGSQQFDDGSDDDSFQAASDDDSFQAGPYGAATGSDMSTPKASTVRDASQQEHQSPSKEQLIAMIKENPLVHIFCERVESESLADMDSDVLFESLELFCGRLLPSTDDPSYKTLKMKLHGSIGSILRNEMSSSELAESLVGEGAANDHCLASSIFDTIVNGLDVLNSISNNEIDLPEVERLVHDDVANLSFIELVQRLGGKVLKIGVAFVMLEFRDSGEFVADADVIGSHVFGLQRVPFTFCHIVEIVRRNEKGNNEDFSFGVYSSSQEEARIALNAIVSKSFSDPEVQQCRIASSGREGDRPSLPVSDEVFGVLASLKKTDLVVSIQKATIAQSQVSAAAGFGGSSVFDQCEIDAGVCAKILASLPKIVFTGRSPAFAAIKDGMKSIKKGGGVKAILLKDISIRTDEQFNDIFGLIALAKECGVMMWFLNTPNEPELMKTFRKQLRQKSLGVRILDPNESVDIIRRMGQPSAPLKSPPKSPPKQKADGTQTKTSETDTTVASSSTGMVEPGATAENLNGWHGTELGTAVVKWKCSSCWLLVAGEGLKCPSCEAPRPSPTTVVESPGTAFSSSVSGNATTVPFVRGGFSTMAASSAGGGFSTMGASSAGGGFSLMPPSAGGGFSLMPPSAGGGFSLMPPSAGGGFSFMPPSAGGTMAAPSGETESGNEGIQGEKVENDLEKDDLQHDVQGESVQDETDRPPVSQRSSRRGNKGRTTSLRYEDEYY